MTIQIISLAIYILFIAYLKYSTKDKSDKVGKYTLFMLLGAGLLLRFIISYQSQGYDTDMNCFKSWSLQVASVLPWNFYDSIWCDYPPGYLYVLMPFGFLGNMGINAELFEAIIKLPACICDILSAYIIYKIAKEKFSENISVAAASVYIFNPATIVNSAMWGQVDSVYTLLFICSIYYLFNEKIL